MCRLLSLFSLTSEGKAGGAPACFHSSWLVGTTERGSPLLLRPTASPAPLVGCPAGAAAGAPGRTRSRSSARRPWSDAQQVLFSRAGAPEMTPLLPQLTACPSQNGLLQLPREHPGRGACCTRCGDLRTLPGLPRGLWVKCTRFRDGPSVLECGTRRWNQDSRSAPGSSPAH